MNDIELITDSKLIDEIVKRAEEYQKQKEIEFAIEEIEKIKAEFLDKCQNYYRFDNEIILNGFEELIDKHIAELKGENKP